MADENRNQFFGNEENNNPNFDSAQQDQQSFTEQAYNDAPMYQPQPETNFQQTQTMYNPSYQQNINSAPRYNTGYYSSQTPGQAPTHTMYSYPTMPQYPFPVYEEKEPKKEKKKGSFKIISLCVVISLICGILGGALSGALIVNNALNKDEKEVIDTDKNSDKTTDKTTDNTDKNDKNDDQNDGKEENKTVIYESVETNLPESTADAGTVALVAETALPSVVEIRTEAVSNSSFYGQYVKQGAGSGVIISADGYIVTNNHVVDGASNITVRLSNGDEYTAKLIGTDAQTDIAVIKIEAEGLKPAVYGNSANLIIGELTVAIGNPLGNLGGTVTDGIVSALDREISVEGEKMVLLQTNAAVNPGNSGGGLFNSNGELIGIVNAKSSGDNVEGLGFAIPINTAKPIIQDLIENGHVTGRPSLGVLLVEILTDYEKYMYGVREYGVYIQKSISEELKPGDRIVAVDGNSVSTFSDLKSIINSHKVGDEVSITVSRNSKIIEIKLTLIDSADNTLEADK